MSSENADKKIQSAAVWMMVWQPFFGFLWAGLAKKNSTAVRAVTVNQDTIVYNPEFINKYKTREVTTILIHCIMHIAFNHLYYQRGAGRKRSAWNKSIDIVADGLLHDDMEMTLPSDICNLNVRFSGKSCEEVYHSIEGEYSHDGDPEHLKPDPKQWDDHGTMNRSGHERMLIQVAQAASFAKSAGKMPAGCGRVVDELLDSKVPWYEVLKHIATQSLARKNFSFERPRKSALSLGLLLPSLYSQSSPRMVVGVDTSGSIRQKELNQFCSEIESLAHLAEQCVVMTCDADVHECQTRDMYTTTSQLKFKGGGGTDFVPVFKEVSKRNLHPDILIYLTDGYGRFPERKPNYPVIWVLTEGDVDVPFGRKLKMDVAYQHTSH